MADKKQNRRNNKNYDEDYNPRFRKQRKKVCVLCSDKNFELDYKNPEQLRKFINDKGKILPRRTTGACAKHQRHIAEQIKYARFMALVPYVNEKNQVKAVCVGTNKKNDLQYYYDRPRRTGDYHGQGPVLWCTVALLEK